MSRHGATLGKYAPLHRGHQLVFETALREGQQLGGVRVSEVVEDPAPLRMEYRPGHPLADENGYVAMPNVEPAHEMVNMIAASRSYQANVEIMNTSKQLMLKTLTLGEG